MVDGAETEHAVERGVAERHRLRDPAHQPEPHAALRHHLARAREHGGRGVDGDGVDAGERQLGGMDSLRCRDIEGAARVAAEREIGVHAQHSADQVLVVEPIDPVRAYPRGVPVELEVGRGKRGLGRGCVRWSRRGVQAPPIA